MIWIAMVCDLPHLVGLKHSQFSKNPGQSKHRFLPPHVHYKPVILTRIYIIYTGLYLANKGRDEMTAISQNTQFQMHFIE